LAGITDRRKLAVDALGNGPISRNRRSTRLSETFLDIGKASAPALGTPMIFCDMGVNPTDGQAPGRLSWPPIRDGTAPALAVRHSEGTCTHQFQLSRGR
jgi:hypothetical protein